MTTIVNKQQGKIFIFLLGLLFLGSALGLSVYFMQHKPKAKRSKHVEKIAPRVETTTLKTIDHQIVLHTVGNVIAAKQVNLKAQLSGEIVKVNKNFLPGGRVKQKEILLTIEDLDYRLAKIQKSSQVEKALNDLEIEKGKQTVAKTEYKLLGNELAVKDRKLILRKPQLKLAEANLKAARAQLEQAQANLERTRIKSPFNALIQDIQVNQGSWVNPGSKLVKLIGTDQYWIEVSLPVKDLEQIFIPDYNSRQASRVIIRYRRAWGEKTRQAAIKRLKPNIDPGVRMAQLLIEVDDPLSLQKNNKPLPKLLMGSFVEADIYGKTLKNVYAVPRQAVHNGNTLWLLSTQNRLQFKKIKPVWKNNDFIYISAQTLDPEHVLIVSDLAAPVENMQLNPVKE